MADIGLEARRSLMGLHGLVLSFPVALFTGAVLTDIAYLKTAEVQWTNFSAWLITGAMVFCGIAVAWALVRLVLSFRSVSHPWRIIEFALLAVMFGLGLINAFKHSQDGWSSVGAFGLILSVICAVLALASGFIAFSGSADRESAR